MDESLRLRATGGDWKAIDSLLGKAFGEPISEEEAAAERLRFEPERSLGAYDEELLVGHLAGFSFRMRVPGAITPVAGISLVGVLPTHRRRGILRALMKRQLDDLHESQTGEAIAALTVSEPSIYGRFGFGIASDRLNVEIDSRPAIREVAGLEEISIRYADPAESLELLGALHTEATADRPGSFVQQGNWLQAQIADPPAGRGGGTELRCVLAERPGRAGRPTGYALYRTIPSWDDTGPAGTVAVNRLHGLDLPSTVAIWRFLLDQDLMAKATYRGLPPDDPFLALLLDQRRARISMRDGLWVRLVEVDRALAARSYTQDIDIVLEVTDPCCAWNSGRWRLEAKAGGEARCARTPDRADLALDVRELGAAYLGKPTLTTATRAGLVTEHSAGAARRASQAFANDPLPWMDTGF